MGVVRIGDRARGWSGIDHLSTTVGAQALGQTSTVIQTALLPVQRTRPATDRNAALATLASTAVAQPSKQSTTTAVAVARTTLPRLARVAMTTGAMCGTSSENKQPREQGDHHYRFHRGYPSTERPPLTVFKMGPSTTCDAAQSALRHTQSALRAPDNQRIVRTPTILRTAPWQIIPSFPKMKPSRPS